MDFGQASPGQHLWPEGGAGVEPADCAGVGFGAVRAGGLLPVEAAGGCKTLAVAELAPSMTLKSYWVQKP